MDVRQALGDLGRRWWIVAIVIVLCAGAAGAYTYLLGARYTATAETVVSISKPSERTSYVLTSGSLYVTARMSSLAALGQSDNVIAAAAAATDGARNADQVRDGLTVTAVVETSVLRVQASDPSPQLAAEMANAAALAIGQSISRLEHQELVATLVTPAVASTTPSLAPYVRTVGVGLVGGFLLGSAVALLVAAVGRRRVTKGSG